MPAPPPLPALLTGLARRGATSPAAAAARQLHAHLLIRGLPLPARAAVALVASSSSPRHARAVFDSVPAASANVYLWTATISAYARHASSSSSHALEVAGEAVALFALMLWSGPRPNAFTVTSVIKCCLEGRAGLLLRARGRCVARSVREYWPGGRCKEGVDEMPVKNVVVGNTMVACNVRAGDMGAAREVFDGMAERDPISWNTLMSGYLHLGDTATVRELFDEMTVRNVNSWNTMIAACSEEGSLADTVKVFNRMRATGFEPDAATMAVLMSACAQLGSLTIAGQVHGLLQKSCVEMNCHVQNSLIDMYAKCGCISQAQFLFTETYPKDTVSYNVMIIAFAQHGHARDALDLFNAMVDSGLQPDAVTFLGVLSACAHAGLVEYGKNYFELMKTTYAVQQSPDHYACVVDLYGRAGLIEEAHCFVKTMPVKPHAGVWGALLNACRKHCHVDVGEIAAKELIRIEPKNPGNYVLLRNTLARGQQWDAVEDVQLSMRRKVIDKTAGCSWVEVDSVVHEFLAGDFYHPKFDEIYTILEHLYMELT
ncbi:hypothetical protein OsJ_36137 [Oryza sativa Japonica Group]|uniref:Uncharacterized protein n=1 Tax=Oryza sativa subsp. japonica TaxID=39947 RepID=B9GD79_ORYSJ|nr:hypothetical protein OsJ_36137 [Oryza sativa Japonica Group]